MKATGLEQVHLEADRGPLRKRCSQIGNLGRRAEHDAERRPQLVSQMGREVSEARNFASAYHAMANRDR